MESVTTINYDDTSEVVEALTNWPLIINIIVGIVCLIIFVVVLYILYNIDDPGLKKEKQKYDQVTTCDPNDVENTLPKNVVLKLKNLSATNNTNSVTGHGANSERNHATVTSLPPNHLPEEKSRRRTYSDTTSNDNQHHRKRTNSETQRYLEGMLRRPSSTRLVLKAEQQRTRSKSTSETVSNRNKENFFIIEEEDDVMVGVSVSGDRRQSETAAANVRMNNQTIS